MTEAAEAADPCYVSGSGDLPSLSGSSYLSANPFVGKAGPEPESQGARSVGVLAVVGDPQQCPGGGLSSGAYRYLTAWRGDSFGQAPCAHPVDQQSHGAIGFAPDGGVSGPCHLGARWGRGGAREGQNQCKTARDVAGSGQAEIPYGTRHTAEICCAVRVVGDWDEPLEPPSQGGSVGSNPIGATKQNPLQRKGFCAFTGRALVGLGPRVGRVRLRRLHRVG